MDGDDAIGKGQSKPRKRSRLRRQAARKALPWIVIIAIFVLWEIVVRAFDIEQFVLPAPTAIFASAWEWRAEMLDNAWQTFMTTVVGFSFAVIFGLVGGVLFGSSTLIYDGFYPALVGFNSIPKVAVIPILVIWFGIGTVPAIVTAFLISFFPMLGIVAAGIATLDPELRDVLRALAAKQQQNVQQRGLRRERPYYAWPGGKRLVFYVALNIEHFAFGAGIGMDPVRSGLQTTRNWAWRDYGNRIGNWRLFEILDALKLPATILLNSTVCYNYPEIVEKIRLRGDDVIGHGRTNAELLRGMWQADEQRAIEECTH